MIELVLQASDLGLLGNQAYRNFAYGLGAFWLQLAYGGDPAFPGQSYTMYVTYAFLHGGLLHLVVNMMALYSIGKAIIRRVGERRFLIAYTVSLLGGAIGFALLSKSTAPMVGASGALFGLLGVWICWDYMDRKHYGDSIRATYKALLYLFAYNLVFWLLLSGRLAWETHFGGFVAGWLLALYWGRGVYMRKRRQRRQPRSDSDPE